MKQLINRKAFHLKINDLFIELKEENNRLLNELKTSDKLNKLLENQRNLLIKCLNNCLNCGQNEEIKHNLNDLDIAYNRELNFAKELAKENQINCNNSQQNMEIIVMNTKKKYKKRLKNKTIIGTKDEIRDENIDNKSKSSSNSRDLDSDYDPIEEELIEQKPIKPISAKNSNMEKKKSFGFYCNFCDYFNVHSKRVESHMNSIHLNLRPYKCDICSKDFTSQINLDKHSKVRHSNEAKEYFYCDWNECKFKTQSQSYIKEHLLRHSGVKPFKCQFPSCEQSFVAKKDLHCHQLKHSEDKKYRCEWPGCDSSFKSSGTKKQHMLTHTGLKPFKCVWPGCDQSFGDKPKLNRHLLCVHKDDRNYVCHWPHCERRFARKDNLQQHIRVHKGIRPHKCPFEGCERTFAVKSNMFKHHSIHNKAKPIQ